MNSRIAQRVQPSSFKNKRDYNASNEDVFHNLFITINSQKVSAFISTKHQNIKIITKRHNINRHTLFDMSGKEQLQKYPVDIIYLYNESNILKQEKVIKNIKDNQSIPFKRTKPKIRIQLSVKYDQLNRFCLCFVYLISKILKQENKPEKRRLIDPPRSKELYIKCDCNCPLTLIQFNCCCLFCYKSKYLNSLYNQLFVKIICMKKDDDDEIIVNLDLEKRQRRKERKQKKKNQSEQKINRSEQKIQLKSNSKRKNSNTLRSRSLSKKQQQSLRASIKRSQYQQSLKAKRKVDISQLLRRVAYLEEHAVIRDDDDDDDDDDALIQPPDGDALIQLPALSDTIRSLRGILIFVLNIFLFLIRNISFVLAAIFVLLVIYLTSKEDSRCNEASICCIGKMYVCPN